jgi:hypothetical protein
MGRLLDNEGCARGFEFWVYIPDFEEFQKQFPVCVERLRAFRNLSCGVKIFLGNENGADAALELAGPWLKDSRAGVLICEPLAQYFEQPLLRRTAFDDDSDYAIPTSEGFELVEPAESNRLERAFIGALGASDAHIRRPKAA